MAIFKCKMCGGDLEVNEKMTVGTCNYCGSIMTFPKLDDDKRTNLYDRANHFRRNNEFDKAMTIYESILNEDKTDAEAYWSIVLCKYGIEYVEDPRTHKRVPTCNRTQFTSVFADEDYKQAILYADLSAKALYEQEAKIIDEIQKGILEISAKEEPFDVFICYKESNQNGRRTPDSVLAQDLYFQLKQEGFKVFFSRITLEDKLGTAYEPYIFAALNSSKVMVVVGTRSENFSAVWVKNEWSRYLSLIKNNKSKTLIPAYKDMDPYDLPEEFSNLQAQDMGKLGFMQDLIRGIKKIVNSYNNKITEKAEIPTINQVNTNTEGLLERAFIFLEDGNFKAADEYLERVLDANPKNAKAYIGKLMLQMEVKEESGLANCFQPFDDNNNFQKALRFADATYKAKILGYNQAVCDEIGMISEHKKSTLLKLKVGNIVQFGSYSQHDNPSNEKETIEWKVLAVENGEVLLISEKCIDCKPINNESESNQWVESTLRKWLNTDFYNMVFTEDEKSIISVKNTSYFEQQSSSDVKFVKRRGLLSSIFGSDEDCATTQLLASDNRNNGELNMPDRIFLLSIEEVEKYFPCDTERITSASPYAVKLGVSTIWEGNCSWWLRSPGKYPSSFCIVSGDGHVYFGESGYVKGTGIGVRPALWLNLPS